MLVNPNPSVQRRKPLYNKNSSFASKASQTNPKSGTLKYLEDKALHMIET